MSLRRFSSASHGVGLFGLIADDVSKSISVISRVENGKLYGQSRKLERKAVGPVASWIFMRPQHHFHGILESGCWYLPGKTKSPVLNLFKRRRIASRSRGQCTRCSRPASSVAGTVQISYRGRFLTTAFPRFRQNELPQDASFQPIAEVRFTLAQLGNEGRNIVIRHCGMMARESFKGRGQRWSRCLATGPDSRLRGTLGLGASKTFQRARAP